MIEVFVTETLKCPLPSSPAITTGVGTGFVPTSQFWFVGVRTALPLPFAYGTPFGSFTVPVIVTVCAFVTLVRFTVTSGPLTLKLLTIAKPSFEATEALPTVTVFAKLIITV